jgi:hypothetical protein
MTLGIIAVGLDASRAPRHHTRMKKDPGSKKALVVSKQTIKHLRTQSGIKAGAKTHHCATAACPVTTAINCPR